jgi:glucose-1-phosphate adenylyltransferase
METNTRVLAFVLAGGEGRRLAPLTRHVAKPAIPFHKSHRLIDFALSNLRNSGVRAIHVLMQYQPQSVLQHLIACWHCGRSDADGFVHPVIGGSSGVPAFAGTADAVYCNRQEIIDFCPDVVAVFSADHIYRMDVRQMIDFHLASGADVTVSALPVPLAEARSFGVIEADTSGRIRRFAEKPPQPRPMPGRPDHAFASMGNYLFSPRVLLEALEATHAAGGTDFGGHLLPSLVDGHRLMAYDFTSNRIDGLPAGCDPHYWRDVGTLDAYFAAHMDTMGAPAQAPRFDVNARCWPIRSATPAFDAARGEWSLGRYRSMATVAASASVEHSILRPGVRVGERAEVFRSILGENVDVGAGCRLRNVIIEADNHVPPGFEVGFDPATDRDWLPVSEGGVVVIPRGFFSTTQLARAVARGLGSGTAPAIIPPGIAGNVPAAGMGSGASTHTVTPMVPALAAGAAPTLPRRREAATAETPSTHAARA